MSQIKGKNTKPEMIVRKYLHSKGLRFRLHNKKLPGKPDLSFRKYKTVVFENGCFWHGHENCKYFVLPKTRTEWWKNKIYKNKERDLKKVSELTKLGWRVITFWECDLKKENITEKLESLYLAIIK